MAGCSPALEVGVRVPVALPSSEQRSPTLPWLPSDLPPADSALKAPTGGGGGVGGRGGVLEARFPRLAPHALPPVLPLGSPLPLRSARRPPSTIPPHLHTACKGAGHSRDRDTLGVGRSDEISPQWGCCGEEGGLPEAQAIAAAATGGCATVPHSGAAEVPLGWLATAPSVWRSLRKPISSLRGGGGVRETGGGAPGWRRPRAVGGLCRPMWLNASLRSRG